jgi:uncharacterized protein YegL
MAIAIKIEYHGELRRLPRPNASEHTFKDISQASSHAFNIDPGSSLSFEWRDTDGDVITFNTQDEFEAALDHAHAEKWKTLRLTLRVHEDTEQASEPQPDLEPEVKGSMSEHHLKVLALDRSGSMASFGSEMRDGVNTFLEESLKNKEASNTISVSVVTFDHTIEEPLATTLLDETVSIQPEWISPRGCTALLDGIKHAINAADQQVESSDNNITADTTEIVIFTDGQENSSKISSHELNQLIQDRTKKGYVFTFLAANQDAIATAAQIGIGAGRAMTCSGDREHQQAAWSAVTATPMRAAFSSSIRNQSCSVQDASRYNVQHGCSTSGPKSGMPATSSLKVPPCAPTPRGFSFPGFSFGSSSSLKTPAQNPFVQSPCSPAKNRR